jgi:polysaccharide pyruvyl transferase WcaK-like protein
MRVGILTYFDGINYGAFAQVFALQSRLVELGFNVEVIAYKDNKHKINEYRSLFLTINLKILINNIEKLKVFRKAQKKLNTTQRVSRVSQVVDMKFDKIIIGSDEIWNFKNDLFGLNLIYFGKDLNDKTNVFSYAASFGSICKDELIPKEVISNISKLSAVSVRDDNSSDLICKFLSDAKKVVDPTLLYDYKNETKDINIASDYLLFYGITLQGEDQKFIQEMVNYSKLKGLRLISVGYHHDWADENYVNIHPFSWLKYIKNANYVVTNMFHGTVFSIKFNKRFLTIASKRRENKVGSLLREFGLESRLCDSSDINEDFSERINAEISYESINFQINTLKNLSEKFLIESLTK